MSHDPQQSEQEAVDRLVGEYLDRLSEQVDASTLIDRVCGQLPLSSEDPKDVPLLRPGTEGAQTAAHTARVSGSFRALGWTLATALALVLAFWGGRSFPPSTADAATVLRDVHAVHQQKVDRCYQVHFAPDPEYWDGKNVFKGPSDTVLWTRGDRFWADAELGDVRLVYGRDEAGTIWVSPSRSTGIHLSSGDEPLPDEIAMYCAINSMTVPSLVEDVLADFDLKADRRGEHRQSRGNAHRASAAGHSVIWANLKPGHTHPLIASALLEVDSTDTLVRLVLWTVHNGGPRGVVTFTLVKTDRIADEQYQLQSHLDADAKIKVHQLNTKSGPAEER